MLLISIEKVSLKGKLNKQILSNIFNIMLIRCIFITYIFDAIGKYNLKVKSIYI